MNVDVLWELAQVIENGVNPFLVLRRKILLPFIKGDEKENATPKANCDKFLQLLKRNRFDMIANTMQK